MDLTVTKEWNDGDGKLRDALTKANEVLQEKNLPTISPYLELEFASEKAGYKIGTYQAGDVSESGDGQVGSGYVSLGGTRTPILDSKGKNVPFRQPIELTVKDESGNAVNSQEIYFWNLPKYDADGTVVRYQVKEVWCTTQTNANADGSTTVVPITGSLYDYLKGKLGENSEIWKEIEGTLASYSTTITEGTYVSNDEADPGSDGQPLHDKQPITVVNRLGNTKTVSWHKHWNDVYTNANNQRPDLYLDIYQVKRGTNGEPEVTIFREDYLWTMDEIQNGVGEGDSNTGVAVMSQRVEDNYNWTVTMYDVPKYDEQGYEIFYYAVERTKIDFESYDYEIAQYSYPLKNNPGEMIDLGSRDELLPALGEDRENYVGYGKYLLDMRGDSASSAIPEENKADYPHYALLEGGTITNGLSNHVTIQGRKVWVGTEGFPREDLPDVTFAVDQYLGNEMTPEVKKIAWITVSDWTHPEADGTYTFEISYTGDNTKLSTQTDDPEGVGNLLPRYAPDGSLYTYRLREESIEWVGTDETQNVPNYEGIFTIEGSEENNFTLRNDYTESPKGSIFVKKHLELPADLGADDKFPSIQFKLTRTYTGKGGEEKADTAFNNANHTVPWKWDAIKNAYIEAQGSTSNGSVWVTSGETDLVFTGLELYAPNGSKYVYKVEEVIDGFLYGYTTSSGIGKLERDPSSGSSYSESSFVEKLSPAQTEITTPEGGGAGTEQPDSSWATFKNALDQKTVTLEGGKIWKDYVNVFNLRPGWDKSNDKPIGFSLALSRYANEQENEGNPILEEALEESKDYKITWVKDDSTGIWTYTITGTDENKLDAYAPNGMPWIYKVTESMEPNLLEQGIYRATPAKSVTGSADQAVEGENASITITMPAITNTMSSATTFKKQWKVLDENGEPQDVTGDYLGKDLSVTVKVQVREKDGAASSDSGNWQEAETYFTSALSEDAYNKIFPKEGETSYFERTITGRLNGTWSETFDNLPAAIRKVSSNDQGIEEKITYLEYRVVETQVVYDSKTQVITIGKESNSSDYSINAPAGGIVIDADLDNNLQTTNILDLQSITIEKIWKDNNNQWNTRPNPTGDYTWETSFVVQKKNGSDWENVQVYTGETSQDLVVTLRGDNEAPTGGWTATITGLPADEYRIRELQPGWNDDSQITDKDMVGDGGYYYGNAYKATYEERGNHFIVTNRLETILDTDDASITAVKKWYPEEELPEGTTVTVTLQYSNDRGATWKFFASETLPGENKWTYTWTGLPEYYLGSTIPTQYRVIEEGSANGYIQVNPGEEQKGSIWKFVNVSTTSLTVTKEWKGVAEEDREEVVVQLYRSTDGSTTNGTPVEGERLTLSAGNWTGTFDNLPAYDADGKPYTYYARETTTGDFIPSYTDAADGGNFTTAITNVAKTQVTVIKTWVDNGNHPDGLELTLYRSTNNSDEKIVKTVTIQGTGNTWNHTFTDLPKTDTAGNVYTYRVEEKVPDGYDGKTEVSADSGFHFTNVKEGSLTVYKRVTGSGGSYTRDFQFTVTLTGESTSGIKANSFNEVVQTSAGSIQFKTAWPHSLCAITSPSPSTACPPGWAMR